MKVIIKTIPLLWLVAIAGCGDDGKPSKAEDTVLKTQKDALNKAQQVEQTVMDTADKQRKIIDKETEQAE